MTHDILNFIQTFDEKQSALLNWVINAHDDHSLSPEKARRKYTGESYWEHPVTVAYIATRYTGEPYVIEIALLHDVVEDTIFSYLDVLVELNNIGYDKFARQEIIKGLRNLTDQYTAETYPHWNRKKRKALEALRLSEIAPRDQTIKYADLEDNTSSIVKHDPEFAKTYLREKREILTTMNKGNPLLYQKLCCEVFLKEESLYK